ncbi:peptidylprolyl isomerase [Alteromonas gilva]|uniref:Peptidyl-prolyl cis-trans isomerase n=1 Tax=Alteromonas gilva TaxID=2987522 RepID=A0ABT5L5S0_9ALTE|nr:peptidylprolyl isomerase [Alteromonas gilva]MDC8832400.1 peptidylprolyl isomerase [Alteromonas gilva]
MLKALFFSLILLSAPSLAAKKTDDGSHVQPDNYYPRVKLETSMGDIVIELDRRRAPITVNNFLRYVDKRSYDDTLFQRIISGYIVQGGGYTLDYEEKSSYPAIFNESGNGLKNERYTVAMARQNDPHTATRQFFFNLDDNDNLDPGRTWGYTVFGTVVEGYDVVDAMGEVETEYKALLGFADAPVENVILKKATVLPPIM